MHDDQILDEIVVGQSVSSHRRSVMLSQPLLDGCALIYVAISAYDRLEQDILKIKQPGVKKKKKKLTSICQPTRTIACADYGPSDDNESSTGMNDMQCGCDQMKSVLPVNLQ